MSRIIAFFSRRVLTTNMWGFFKMKAETPQLYLNLTKECMSQAESMVASRSLKFNHEQCKYLAAKLKEAVQGAHSFFQPTKTWYSDFASDEDRARSLEIFKLLFVLGKEIETFIQGCSRDARAQLSPMLLIDASEHTSSLGFDLDLCIIIFSKRKTFGALPALTDSEVAKLRKVEGENVEAMSNIDQMALQWYLSTVIENTRSSSADRQQATLLLERLKTLRPFSTAHSQGSNQSNRPEINLRSLQELGKGTFATVHKAIWQGTEVAIKSFCKLDNGQVFEQEVKIQEGLFHPNIVPLLWYTTDRLKCYMIMELMDEDLWTFMQKRLECGASVPFSISEVFHIILQVAEGMLFLHEKRIVHRDLKSSNILVKRMKVREVGDKYVHVKVADFGLSKTKEKSKSFSSLTQNQGTTRWMAPEIIRTGNSDDYAEVQKVEGASKYPFKVDVYSFGMVCLEILTGKMPFSTLNLNEVKMKVLAGERPQLPENCPNSLRHLIEACWKTNPEDRPRFVEICAELRHLKYAHYMTAAWAKTPRIFTLEEIKRMTNKLNNCVGSGFAPFAMVYKGAAVDTGEVVAVNTELNAQNAKDESAHDKFRVQMEVLPRLHHNNVVGYAGFFLEKDVGFHVFEYMPNGSLDKWLVEPALKRKMTWPVRRDICLGVADGIHYLHSLSQPKIIHCAIKPSHVWLDQNLEPKLANFSSAHLLPDDEFETKVDRVAATREHSAPEYLKDGILSQKVDVYSFGVVLLEIVSGRKSIDRELVFLPGWALRLRTDRRINELIDSSLHLQRDEEMEAVRIIELALLCVDPVRERRPDMGLVAQMLVAIRDPDTLSSQPILEHLRERLGTSMDWSRFSFGSSSLASSLASLDSNGSSAYKFCSQLDSILSTN